MSALPEAKSQGTKLTHGPLPALPRAGSPDARWLSASMISSRASPFQHKVEAVQVRPMR